MVETNERPALREMRCRIGEPRDNSHACAPAFGMELCGSRLEAGGLRRRRDGAPRIGDPERPLQVLVPQDGQSLTQGIDDFLGDEDRQPGAAGNETVDQVLRRAADASLLGDAAPGRVIAQFVKL